MVRVNVNYQHSNYPRPVVKCTSFFSVKLAILLKKNAKIVAFDFKLHKHLVLLMLQQFFEKYRTEYRTGTAVLF